MARALSHRGPDGEGVWIDESRRIGFSHRRLAIIDLDRRAAQPMHNEDGSVTIVFNGEIYNHRALRAQLQTSGHVFRTDSSDTESLIHGYEEWGIDGLLKRIDGIYSFALHDGRHQVTHLVRDGLGIKPLYVAWLGMGAQTHLLFASEMRAILAHREFQAEPATAALRSYFTFMSVPAPGTFMKGVFKIPAGHRLAIAADGKAMLQRTCNDVSEKVPQSMTFEAARDGVRKHLEHAVASQMIADVPVSVMLSGGIDSGAILALASRLHGKLDAFTIRFDDDPESDETLAAGEMARFCGARHHIFTLTPDMVFDGMDSVIAAQDEPQADWVCLPLWFLAREVARNACKVILVGEGADEQFAGYAHWRPYIETIAAYAAHARLSGRIGNLVARAGAAAFGANMRMLTRLDFLDRAARGDPMFWGGAVLAWPMVADALIEHDPHESNQPRWIVQQPTPFGSVMPDAKSFMRNCYAEIDRIGPDRDPLQRMISLEFMHRLPELLLMRVDKMTMAHGVEARVPFLAKAMVEYSSQIPSPLKWDGPQPKWLLREAVRDLLPASLVDAPKKGFGAPVDRWLRGTFGRVAEDEICNGPLNARLHLPRIRQLFREHGTARANHAGILWALYLASRWMHMTVEARP